MMTKSRSARMAGIKAVLALPALLAVLFFFSAGNINTISAQDSQKEKELKAKQSQMTETTQEGNVYTEVKNPPEYDGGFEKMIQFLVANIIICFCFNVCGIILQKPQFVHGFD